MGTIIRPRDVRRQLEAKRKNEVKIQQWCVERMTHIETFVNEDALQGEAWKAAKRRMNEYHLFFSCLRYGAEMAYGVDGTVHGLVGQYFGEAEEVNEDKLRAAQAEALSKVDYFADKARKVSKMPPPIPQLFKGGYRDKVNQWHAREQEAAEMLRKINQYLQATSGLYRSTNAMELSLTKGARALKAARYDQKKSTWGQVDHTWAAEMKQASSSGVKTADDLYDPKTGLLDQSKVSAIAHKPIELWTPEEYAAMQEAYDRSCQDAALCNDPRNLNIFLNSSYVPVDSKATYEGSNPNYTADTYSVTTTYQMTPSMAGFFMEQADRYNDMAYNTDGPLKPEEYLAAGVAMGMVSSALTLTVTKQVSKGEEWDGSKKGQRVFNSEGDLSNRAERAEQEETEAYADGPNIRVAPNQKADVGNGTAPIRYDDISFGERGDGEQKHIYITRDNGRADSNINAQNVLKAKQDVVAAEEDLGNYEAENAQKEIGKRVQKTIKKQLVKIVTDAVPGAKVVDDVFDTVVDISEAIDGYSEGVEEVRKAYDELDRQVEISRQNAVVDAAQADRGISVYCPDTNKSDLGCMGFDDADKRSRYERDLAEYERYKREKGLELTEQDMTFEGYKNRRIS